MQKWRAARYVGEFSIACGIAIAPLLSGSGKFTAPFARMHRENLSASASTRGCAMAEYVGTRDLHAFCAVPICELLTPS
jgi:hypothetical protein